eukprot:6721880-Ditylum_brightwellii.AAC.1
MLTNHQSDTNIAMITSRVEKDKEKPHPHRVAEENVDDTYAATADQRAQEADTPAIIATCMT